MSQKKSTKKAKKVASKRPPKGITKKLGAKTYWQLFRILSDEIEKRKIYFTIAEKRKLLKEKIYPTYKGKKLKTSELKAVRTFISATLDNELQSKGNFYNPLLIPSAFLSGIFWFELDEYLATTLRAEVDPLDLRFQINAGDQGGATPILTISNYEYYSTSINEIIEKVRDMVENGSDAEWNGIPVVREGFTDDGKADSYFVQFTLYIAGNEVPPTEIFDYATTEVDEGTLEARRKRRKEIAVRKKELAKLRREAEKQRKIKKTALPTKKVKAEKLTLEQQKERAQNIQRQMDYQTELLKDSERLFREGILSKEDFLEERKKIMELTQTAISKYEKGGTL